MHNHSIDLKKMSEMRRHKEADSNVLFVSDFYQIVDFKCRCKACGPSKPEYQQSFSICFIRKGHFIYKVFRNSFDAHNSRILIDKPGYEYTVSHINPVPDVSTIFDFTREFYRELKDRFGWSKNSFLENDDVQSILLKASVGTDYLHDLIIKKTKRHGFSKFEMDLLVMEFVEWVMNSISEPPGKVTGNILKNHLTTIENAKQYMAENFAEDISLMDVANHCCVSPFHFSRMFKAVTGYAPYQYLVDLRLHHAVTLIRTTSLSITDICFQSGFNSSDYFCAAFTKKYRFAPSNYRIKFG